MSEFYLKILSGNHIGAEIPLEPGQYSLGKNENCDLILTDATLHGTELVIQIKEDGQLNIFPKQEDEPVYHNGNLTNDPFSIAAFDVVTSSGLYFTLGPVEADWPDIVLPELQRPEPEPVALPIEDDDLFGDNDELPDVDLGDGDEDDEGPDLEFDDDDRDEGRFENEEEETSSRPAINKKILLAIPATLLTLIIALIFLLLSDSSSEEEQSEFSFSDQAIMIRNEMNANHVRIKTLPDQSLLLTGYTPTLSDKQSLQRELREKSIPFSSQLVVMNELRANADALLQNRGYKNIQLELDNTPGSLVMTGYVASAEELSRIINMLKQEIHGLISIVDQVENQASRLNTLKSMLREKNLSARIHLIQKPDQITLEGHLLDDEQVYNLNEVVSRFRKRYSDNPALKVATRSSTGAKQQQPGKPILLPSLSIRGISMGKVPYVTMEDGAKYLIGAKLANGYIIEDINLEYLLLTKGKDRIKYRLGGNRGGQKTE